MKLERHRATDRCAASRCSGSINAIVAMLGGGLVQRRKRNRIGHHLAGLIVQALALGQLDRADFDGRADHVRLGGDRRPHRRRQGRRSRFALHHDVFGEAAHTHPRADGLRPACCRAARQLSSEGDSRTNLGVERCVGGVGAVKIKGKRSYAAGAVCGERERSAPRSAVGEDPLGAIHARGLGFADPQAPRGRRHFAGASGHDRHEIHKSETKRLQFATPRYLRKQLSDATPRRRANMSAPRPTIVAACVLHRGLVFCTRSSNELARAHMQLCRWAVRSMLEHEPPPSRGEHLSLLDALDAKAERRPHLL